MGMAVPLPPEGDTTWFDWATEVHATLDAGTVADVQATPPTSTVPGTFWIDEDDLALYAYYGGIWAAVGGPMGPAGPAGADGTSIVVKGTDTYANVIAIVAPTQNDLWIQTDTGGGGAIGDGLVYNGSTWVNIGPLQGPTGPTGATGATGDTGPTGPAGLNATQLPQEVNAQVGTTYTLVAADAGKLVTLDNAAAITLTLPQDSDATIAVGTYGDLMTLGAGQLTVVAGTGATMRVSGLAAKSRAQYSRLGWQKIAANTFSLFGDLASA